MAQAGFISFPSREEMNSHVSELVSGNGTSTRAGLNSDATLVHIRNTGSAGTDVNETVHEIFVRDVLQFSSNQDDPLGITGRMNIKAQKSDMAIASTQDSKEVT